jgi:hypothetical protein
METFLNVKWLGVQMIDKRYFAYWSTVYKAMATYRSTLYIECGAVLPEVGASSVAGVLGKLDGGTLGDVVGGVTPEIGSSLAEGLAVGTAGTTLIIRVVPSGKTSGSLKATATSA